MSTITKRGNVTIKSDLSKLSALVEQMKKTKSTVTQVGVLGNKVTRDKDALTNAMIGARHEFGVKSGKHQLPRRSFLKMPVETKLPERKEELGTAAKTAIKTLDFGKFYKKLGSLCENIVHTAFATKGFGTWKELKYPNAKKRKSSAGKVLIDTTQLMNSISSRVAQK